MRRRVKANLIGIVLLAIPAFALAQFRGPTYNISGRVIVPIADFQDMFEVLLVQNLEQPVQATVADNQGRYRFTGLARGTYYVIVKLEGFQEVRQRVDLFTTNDTIVNIILDFKEERIVTPPPDLSGEEPEVVNAADFAVNYPRQVVETLKAAEKDLREGDYEKALPLLEDIVREAPDLYQAHRTLGMIYQKQSRYRDAESEYRTSADLRPNSAAPLINLGSLYVEEAAASTRQGSAVVRRILNEALSNLYAAVKLKPDAAFAYYLLGVTYYRSAFYEEAEDQLKHALMLAPDLLDAHLALANVYIRMQEWQNVVTQLDAWLKVERDSPLRDQVQAMRSKIIEHAAQLR